MEVLVLNGISHKGKQMVSAHGMHWVLHITTDYLAFSREFGPWQYVSPIGTDRLSKNAIWIKKEGDPDYQILQVVDF
jgi:hypothetical protein